MNRTIVALAAMALLVAGCACDADKAGVAPATGITPPMTAVPGTIAVEVESFTLTKADVKTLAGASGGKTVVLTGETSEAVTTVTLAKGAYELVVCGFAPSPEEDAFFVSIGDRVDERLYMKDSAKLSESAKLRFTIEKDGPARLVLQFAEENVQLDRVLITPVK